MLHNPCLGDFGPQPCCFTPHPAHLPDGRAELELPSLLQIQPYHRHTGDRLHCGRLYEGLSAAAIRKSPQLFVEFKRFPKKNDSVPPKNCVMYPFTLQPEVGHSRDTGAIWPLGFVGYVVLPVK